jgi:hypothetical protein
MKKTFCDRCDKEGPVFEYEDRQFCKDCFKELEMYKERMFEQWKKVLYSKVKK